jgi:hypothetical protein
MIKEFIEQIANEIIKRKSITIEGHWKTTLVSSNGHTQIRFGEKKYFIHRIMVAFVHDLDYDDSSWLACHKNECGDGDCCCPDHLYKGTAKKNIRDAIEKGTHNSTYTDFGAIGRAIQKAKTHCPQGHPYEGENLKIGKRGERHCITCERKASRDYMRRRRHSSNL